MRLQFRSPVGGFARARGEGGRRLRSAGASGHVRRLRLATDGRGFAQPPILLRPRCDPVATPWLMARNMSFELFLKKLRTPDWSMALTAKCTCVSPLPPELDAFGPTRSSHCGRPLRDPPE